MRIADLNEDFVVCIDACKEGLGGVLSHNGFTICYESRKLKEHKRNGVGSHSTHSKEKTLPHGKEVQTEDRP
jgi:hypothetical protein